MSDIKLFRIEDGQVQELAGGSVALEKSLQILIERNLDAVLRIQLLGSEYSTGQKHGGRIDTLGIDENGCPTIIEYKRSSNANVINQGLFYLDWLMDHKAEFELLVMNKLGQEVAKAIEWSSPRLLCIAGDFTKYDEHAVQQINRNIELIRYQRFGDDLLLLDLVNVATASADTDDSSAGADAGNGNKYTTQTEYLAKANQQLRDLYESIREFLLNLGDDVREKKLRWYFAFRRLKNFACVEVHPQKQTVVLFLSIDPDTVDIEDGFVRDMRSVGHYGTGDLQVTIRTDADFERAKVLIQRSYEAN